MPAKSHYQYQANIWADRTASIHATEGRHVDWFLVNNSIGIEAVEHDGPELDLIIVEKGISPEDSLDVRIRMNLNQAKAISDVLNRYIMMHDKL